MASSLSPKFTALREPLPTQHEQISLSAPADLLDDAALLPPPRRLNLGLAASSSTPDLTLATTPLTPGAESVHSLPSLPSIQVHRVASDGPISGSLGVGDDKRSKRKSWFPLRKEKPAVPTHGPPAWIVGQDDKVAYDLEDLVNARLVSELWDNEGDCLLYLFPKDSGNGPSFRVKSSIFASSRTLNALAIGNIQCASPGATSIRSHGPTPPSTPGSADGISPVSLNGSFKRSEEQLHLHLPIDWPVSAPDFSLSNVVLSDDVEVLVAMRNLFAFLTGQSLVATRKCQTTFAVFMRLSELLKSLEFSNVDGSTFGELANARFDFFSDKFALADVRTSSEKTVEGIVLGERMKSVKLYNEAFTHAAGKHAEILKAHSPTFRLISPITVNRLSRAAMNVEKQTANVSSFLEDFDFPSIFTGIMSTRKPDVNFGTCRDGYTAMRKLVMHFYKRRWGNWPPKASSRNHLETKGLNRMVLRELYHDLCQVYDLLVDRSNLTNRTIGGVLNDDTEEGSPRAKIFREALSEYDRSCPPVKPPMPFDLPLSPSLKTTRPDFETGDQKKDAKAKSKKLKDDEIAKILAASRNDDVAISNFLAAFKDMERKSAHHGRIQEIDDLRMGHWIFMYAVLQTLPIVVVDGPSLEHTEGVEYFLFEAPKFGVPWAREISMRSASLANPVNEASIAKLPADMVEPGIEGMFYRSHCWTMAEQWNAGNSPILAAMQKQKLAEMNEPFERPPSRPSSAPSMQRPPLNRGSSASRLPRPVGLGIARTGTSSSSYLAPPRRLGAQTARPVSVYNPTATFDSFLDANVSKKK